MQRCLTTIFASFLLVGSLPTAAIAQRDIDDIDNPDSISSISAGLTESEMSAVDDSVNRALQWLAKQQNLNRDGSLPTMPSGQPAITSLTVMAYLSAGHTLEGGSYAKGLRDAVDFALGCQQENGLLSSQRTRPFTERYNGSHTAYYNHGITGLMLCEAYGMTGAEQSKKIEQAIPKAIEILRAGQYNKRRKADQGGWQYYTFHLDVDADMSATTWQLMFLRSAKNAGFDVPEQMVQDAMKFAERCYDPRRKIFNYGNFGRERYTTVGSVGGGILSLSMGGDHGSEMANNAGNWLLRQPFENYNSYISAGGNYHYGLYYASHASYQLGGRYWRELYPRIVNVLLKNQRADGSWPAEAGIGRPYGQCYSTALGVLALTPSYQLLPIYQR